MACSFQRTANAQQLFFCCRGPGHQLSVNRFMQNGPRGREADGARTKSLLDNSRHPRNLGLCRLLIGCTSVAHDVGTHRTVRHLRGDIDGSIQPL